MCLGTLTRNVAKVSEYSKIGVRRNESRLEDLFADTVAERMWC